MSNLNEALHQIGWNLFSLAVIALGVETIVCARFVDHSVGFDYRVVPVIPWLPTVPALAYVCGILVASCGFGLLLRRSVPLCATVLGSYFFVGALLLAVPRYAAHPENMSLRTTVFEPLSVAAIAFLLPAAKMPSGLTKLSRYAIGFSLVVFGVDHLIAILPIAGLIPTWIWLRPFWVAFFGVAFVCAGVSITLNILQSQAWFGLGLMFGTWVCTLHLPRVMGLYGIPGAAHNPNEWQSLLIAVALWGGPWVLLP